MSDVTETFACTIVLSYILVSGPWHCFCALKSDGRLFCWGLNSMGQLGNNSRGGSLVPVQEYTQATDWAQLSAGYRHSCALKQDGRLFCWGKKTNYTPTEPIGYLGDGGTNGSLLPVQEYTAATDWLQVSAGRYHSCAVKKDGRIFCWGGNGSSGKLGNNSSEPIINVPVQEYTEATDWFSVSAGFGNSCALKHDGRMYCWGGSYERVPLQTTAFSTWQSVTVGYNYRCGLVAGDRVFCFGSNTSGKLGTASRQPVRPVEQ